MPEINFLFNMNGHDHFRSLMFSMVLMGCFSFWNDSMLTLIWKRQYTTK